MHLVGGKLVDEYEGVQFILMGIWITFGDGTPYCGWTIRRVSLVVRNGFWPFTVSINRLPLSKWVCLKTGGPKKMWIFRFPFDAILGILRWREMGFVRHSMTHGQGA